MKRPLETFRNHVWAEVVQFGPVRSGSTLVWNALRCFYPDRYIPKRHRLSPLMRGSLNPTKIVCTIRDPRDIIISMIRVSGDPYTEAVVLRHLDGLCRNGMRDAIRLVNRPRVLILRYEEIYQDHSLMLDQIGGFLGVSCGVDARNRFLQKFSVQEIRRRSCELDHFGNFDPDEHIHGGHVSERLGKPGAFRDGLSEELQGLIARRCSRFMQLYGYS